VTFTALSGEDGISVQDAFPVSTRKYLVSTPGKRMMPPADRIQEEQDPGPAATDSREAREDDFQAIGPALRILQLNVEALSAAKRSVIHTIADRHNIDVICLQETRIDSDVSSRFKISGFDLISYRLNDKHGRALYMPKHFAHRPSLCVIQSLNTVVQLGRDPATRHLSTVNLTAPCD